MVFWEIGVCCLWRAEESSKQRRSVSSHIRRRPRDWCQLPSSTSPKLLFILFSCFLNPPFQILTFSKVSPLQLFERKVESMCGTWKESVCWTHTVCMETFVKIHPNGMQCLGDQDCQLEPFFRSINTKISPQIFQRLLCVKKGPRS